MNEVGPNEGKLHVFELPTIRSVLRIWVSVAVLSTSLAGCGRYADAEEEGEAAHPIIVTTAAVRDVPTDQGYVCQVHSRRHIEVRALDEGYLEEIPVQEGQFVRTGQLMFKILPVMYRARLDAHRAELHLAEIHLRNTRQLFEQSIVSDQELALVTAERDRVRAEVSLAEAELRFTNIVAPFDGIVDRQYIQQGSLVEEGDVLTTLSDNHVMWVYFNVPETDYLRFRSIPDATDPANPAALELPGVSITLRLADGRMFDQTAAETITVESDFDNETGNIQFRADFPNPEGVLRHGQTGTLLINEVLHDAVVIPQRATFDILDRQYVYVVGEDGVVHQREIHVSHEMNDIFVLSGGLTSEERFVLDGVRQVHDGERIDVESVSAEEALSNLRHHAE